MVLSEVMTTNKSKKQTEIPISTDILNDFFTEEPIRISAGFGNDLNFRDLKPDTDAVFAFNNVTNEEVDKAYRKLRIGKAIGIDNVSPKIIKCTTAFIAYHHTINESVVQNQEIP